MATKMAREFWNELDDMLPLGASLQQDVPNWPWATKVVVCTSNITTISIPAICSNSHSLTHSYLLCRLAWRAATKVPYSCLFWASFWAVPQMEGLELLFYSSTPGVLGLPSSPLPLWCPVKGCAGDVAWLSPHHMFDLCCLGCSKWGDVSWREYLQVLGVEGYSLLWSLSVILRHSEPYIELWAGLFKARIS